MSDDSSQEMIGLALWRAAAKGDASKVAVEAGGGAPASSDGGAETSTSRSRFPDWQDIETILSEHHVEQTISSHLGRRAKATFPTQEVKQEVEEEAEEGVGGLPAVQPNLRPPT